MHLARSFVFWPTCFAALALALLACSRLNLSAAERVEGERHLLYVAEPGIRNYVQFGGAGIIGVASTSKQKSIKELNGKDHYNEWLFVYDPRLDTPRVGVPGGVAGGNVGSVGSGSGSGSGPGGPGGVPK